MNTCNTTSDTTGIGTTTTLSHGQVVELFGSYLARNTKVSSETRGWGDSRAVNPENLLAFGAVYLPPEPLSWETVEALSYQVGCSVKDLLNAGIVHGRNLRPFKPTRELDGTHHDFDTNTTDRRAELTGFRFRHGGRVAYPLRDLSGRVRGYKSRAVHDDLRSVGKFDVEEEDPPTAKYLHSKRPENEKRSFQLLVSPHVIGVLGPAVEAAKQRTPSTLKGDDRRSLWITEGDVDTMLAHQAGAMAVGLGGCETNEGHILDLLPALEEAARQRLPIFLCLDNDPSRITRGMDLELGAGQRGVCSLIDKLRARSPQLARQIRVVSLDSVSGKTDLADVLASSPDPAAKLKELEAAAVTADEFQVRMIPQGTTRKDWTATIKETGVAGLAAHDPDLFGHWSDTICDRLEMPKSDRKAWAKRVVKEASEQAEIARALEQSSDDVLSRYTNKDGTIRPEHEAVRTLVEQMSAAWDPRARIFWDEMRLVPVMWEKEFTDSALAELRRKLARECLCDVRHKSELREVVENVSQMDRRHPVLEYLKPLKWDGVDRIPMMLEQVLGLEFESDNQRRLYTAFLRCWPIGAVARVHATAEKTVKFDNVLTLGGKQDLRKSSWFQYLVPNKTWSASPDISSFDDTSAQKLCPIWIAEMAESNGSSYWKDLERQKAWLSKESDLVIRKYQAYPEIIPRRFALGATVNEKQHGADSSGFRREWCMWLEKVVDIDLLIEIRDQFWAQAYAAFKAGAQFHLTDEEKLLHLEDGQRFQVADFELDRVREALGLLMMGRDKVTGLEVAAAIGIERPTSSEGRRISRHMSTLGWTVKKGERGNVYSKPAGLTVIDGGGEEHSAGFTTPITPGLTLLPATLAALEEEG